MKNEDKELMQYFLDCTFLPYCKTEYFTSRVFFKNELIITPECNQKCDYCYITNFGKDLYPYNRRVPKEQVLKNIDLILDYFFNTKHFLFTQYDLFAGDLFGTNLFFDSMEIYYKYMSQAYEKVPEYFHENTIGICIPSNLRFVENDEIVNKIYEVIEKFKQIHIRVHFSWSHDGKYSQNIREKIPLSDEYYKKAFTFIDKTQSGIHPMLSFEGINYLKENYDWWLECYHKYLPDRCGPGLIAPYTLEVRNDGWTKEDLCKLEKFIDYKITKLYESFNNDLTEVCKYLYDKQRYDKNYRDCQLDRFFHLSDHTLSCAIQHIYTIRVMDLAIVPCHRLCYDHFNGAYFVLNEDKTKIIDIQENNVNLYIDIKDSRPDYFVKCAACPYNDFCSNGCLGSQYESTGEIFMPVPSVCELEKTIIKAGYLRFKKDGIFKLGHELGLIKPNMQACYDIIEQELCENEQ